MSARNQRLTEERAHSAGPLVVGVAALVAVSPAPPSSMVHLFTTAFPFPFPFPALAYAVINKYPSPLAPHVISIDVLERSILDDGTVRSERLLGVRQDSPRWVNRVSLHPAPLESAWLDRLVTMY